MAMTEQEMRDAKVPEIKTKEELHQYIDDLVERQHDYGTCVYAMSMAATAAFNYVAGKLGVTGFQASCADLDILRRTRSLERFMIVKGEDFLYPQYDPEARVTEYRKSLKDWLAEKADEKLSGKHSAHPDVFDHWLNLSDKPWKEKSQLQHENDESWNEFISGVNRED